MSLHVAVLGGPSAPPLRGSATWGSWGLLPVGDPTVLATDPDVVDPGTSHLLVLAHTSRRGAAQVASATVAAVRPDLAVRLEARPAPLGVLVRALEALPPGDARPTTVAAAVVAGLDASSWGAWLPSVANLATPSPTLRQHVRSWVARGAGFLAVQGSTSWVSQLPLGRSETQRRLVPAAPHGSAPRHECHAFGELPEESVRALFDLGLSTRPVRREPLGDAAEVWGTERAVEFVLAPLPAPTAGPTTGRCPSCEEPVHGPSCPFCRARPATAGLRARATTTTGGEA